MLIKILDVTNYIIIGNTIGAHFGGESVTIELAI